MNQFYYSASSKCLIFYAIISVLICQAVARHRYNYNNLLREKEKGEKKFEHVIKNFPKKVGLLFLRPSSIKLQKSKEYQETSPLNDNVKMNTSCGHINCEEVPNYPISKIRDIFKEQIPIIIPKVADYDTYGTEETEESDTIRDTDGIALGRSYNPSQWLYPDVFPDEENPSKNIKECQSLAEKFRQEQEQKFDEEKTRNNNEICKYKLKETKPKETIDRKNQPSTLVNDDGISVVIKGYECNAGLDCYDRAMPIGYKYHCKTHWDFRDLCTLNDDGSTIIQKSVAIADGCDCISVMNE